MRALTIKRARARLRLMCVHLQMNIHENFVGGQLQSYEIKLEISYWLYLIKLWKKPTQIYTV